MSPSPYDTDLDRNPANFQPLTPLTLLERAAAVFLDFSGRRQKKVGGNCVCFKHRAQPAPSGVYVSVGGV